MKLFKHIYYKLVTPNNDPEVVEFYRQEFSDEQIISNFKSLIALMVILECIEMFIVFMPHILSHIHNAALAFLISNGVLLLMVIRVRHLNYQKSFNYMLGLQTVIVLNFIALGSALNLATINHYDFVHIIIVGLTFIATAFYIPVVFLTLFCLLALFVNVGGVILLQQNPDILQYQVINIITFTFITLYIGIKSNQKTIELWYKSKMQTNMNNRLEDLTKRDSMTNFFNHESILQYMNQSIEKAKSDNNSLSILLLDIDDFKRVNDCFGHLEGDKVIKDVAKVISENVREGDFVGRYGGEEFLIIFPNTNKTNAYAISERICKAVNQLMYSGIRMSVSGGLAEVLDHSTLTLLSLADERLYKAKKEGKNCVVCQ